MILRGYWNLVFSQTGISKSILCVFSCPNFVWLLSPSLCVFLFLSFAWLLSPSLCVFLFQVLRGYWVHHCVSFYSKFCVANESITVWLFIPCFVWLLSPSLSGFLPKFCVTIASTMVCLFTNFCVAIMSTNLCLFSKPFWGYWLFL